MVQGLVLAGDDEVLHVNIGNHLALTMDQNSRFQAMERPFQNNCFHKSESLRIRRTAIVHWNLLLGSQGEVMDFS